MLWQETSRPQQLLLAAEAVDESAHLADLGWNLLKTRCLNSGTDLSMSQAILLGELHFVHLDLIFHKLIDVDCGLQ